MTFVQILTPFLLFILGTCIGSFLSVVIHRLHEGKTGIVFGRSQCPKCKYVLRPVDLIPLLSYIFTRGKCRSCKKSISLTYPFLELITGATFLMLYLFMNNLYVNADLTSISLLAFYHLLFCAFIFTFFYDLKYMEVNDHVVIPMIALSLLMLLHPLYPLTWQSSLIGLAIPVVFFALQIIISKGKWIGGGDLRIGALIGLPLGTGPTVVALILGYLLGAIISLLLLTRPGFTRKSMIPFGPFLVTGFYIAFFFGNTLVDWYLNVLL